MNGQWCPMDERAGACPMNERLLLLDTHVWVWVMQGEPGHLSKRVHDLIEAAAARGALRVSVMSVAELACWEAEGRVTLNKDRLAWVREALATPGLSLAPLTPEIAVESSRLPGDFKGDTTDALLVATARREDMTLVTGDVRLLAYGREHHARTLGVCR